MSSTFIRSLLGAASVFALAHAVAPAAYAKEPGAVNAAAELAAEGEWDSTKTYAKDDIVTSRGSAWISLKANNKNRVPGQTQPSTEIYWQVFARGFNPTGAWSNATKYHPDDLVTFNGQTFRAKLTHTNRQPTNAANWELFAQKGADGEDGEQGIQGAQGPQGGQGIQGEPGPIGPAGPTGETGPQGPAGPNSVANGSVAAPAINFTSSTGTGIFAPEPGKIALASGGNFFLHNKGTRNTGLGLSALQSVSGNWNTAIGDNALLNAGNAFSNTASGFQALVNITTGAYNTAMGVLALGSTVTGSSSTAVGVAALTNSTGSNNSAVGYFALTANVAGNNNIALGYYAGANPTGSSNSIFIGNQGAAEDTATIKIGTQGTQNSTTIAGIHGQTATSGIAVLINSSGKLGTSTSSRRYKDDVETMAQVSATLAKLRPVTFRYKEAAEDGSKPMQYGLIAEEVEAIAPDLAAYNKDGSIETVRYQFLPPLLLAGWQEQQKTINALHNEVRLQKDVNAALEERLRRLEALIPQSRAAALR